MKTFRKVILVETAENLLRRSRESNRLQHETRQQTLSDVVIRNPRRESSQRSEISNSQSFTRYFDYNPSHQRHPYNRLSHRDYPSRSFSSPLNRNHFTTFRPNNRAEDRSERANVSSNHNVTPAPIRGQKAAARHADRHWRYSTISRNPNSPSCTHGNTDLVPNTAENLNWAPNSFALVGNVNRIASSSTPSENINCIAPSSTQSESVNWTEPSSTQSGTVSWATPSTSRSEINWTVSSSTQFGNRISSTSSQSENTNRAFPTLSEASRTSTSQEASEHRRNESYGGQQNEDSVHWFEDRNPLEMAETRSRKSEKIEPNRETISSTISCPVCLCNYEEIRNSGSHFVSGKCGHIICNKCINILLDQRKKCPRCRRSLYQRDIWRLYI